MNERASHQDASIFVIIVKIDETGRYVLMVHNREKETARGIKKSGWSLVGGGQQPMETFRQTIVREVREETGLEISDKTSQEVPLILEMPVGDRHTNVLFGAILYSPEMGELAPRDPAIIEACWVPEYEIKLAYHYLNQEETNENHQPVDSVRRNYYPRHVLMLQSRAIFRDYSVSQDYHYTR